MNKKRSITIKIVLLLAVVCLAGFFTACAKKRTVVFDSCGGTAVETVTVNPGNVHDSVAFDGLYDRLAKRCRTS